MPDQQGVDGRGYRRGVLFGLTVAEMFVLLLFVLLLVWLGENDHQVIAVDRAESLASELAETKRKLADSVRNIGRLQEKLTLAFAPGEAAAFDKAFRELELAREQARRAEQQASALRDLQERLAQQDASSPVDLTDSASRDAVLKRQSVGAVAERFLQAHREFDDVQQQHAFLSEVAMLRRLRERLEEQNASDSDLRQVLTAVSKLERLERENAGLTGQLKNVENRLAAVAGGRGTEKKPCWASAITGRPEYIFDVSLGSETLVMRRLSNPHRLADYAELPVEAVQLDSPVTAATFRSMTAPLFRWSEAHDCRFFVTVLDVTAAHEKARYKRQLRIVGEHFYYFEDLLRDAGTQ